MDVTTGDWVCVDSWWTAYARNRSIGRTSVSARAFGMERPADGWDELEPWWDVYTETGHEAAVALSDLLEESNQQWQCSDAPFDTDPLAADLNNDGHVRGPLRPSTEVSWSRWLARLLRPSAALVRELFGVPVDDAPSEVVREEQLSKRDGSFRRPDILVFHADCGISVEVKLDDENYRKTAETARLVEHHYDDWEWTHVLLFPKRKTRRLDTIVDAPLDRREGGQPVVTWDDPGPIDVLYWRDVTSVIRSLLCRGDAVDDHWAANAYLFCAVAEQQLMNFQPQPVVNRLANPENVVDTLQPIAIADTLEEQLTYLRERVNS